MEYLYLFGSAFISATLFPLASEALLVYDLQQPYLVSTLLILVATLGNSLGSMLNYYFGYKGEEYLESKKIFIKDKIEYYKGYFDKYGGYALLLAWVPIIGDPITIIAGLLRYNVIYFTILVVISKLSRYLFLAYFVV